MRYLRSFWNGLDKGSKSAVKLAPVEFSLGIGSNAAYDKIQSHNKGRAENKHPRKGGN